VRRSSPLAVNNEFVVNSELFIAEYLSFAACQDFAA
jgi:hypothetical protein